MDLEGGARRDNAVVPASPGAASRDLQFRSEEAIRRAQALRADYAEVAIRVAATAAQVRRLAQSIASTHARMPSPPAAHRG